MQAGFSGNAQGVDVSHWQGTIDWPTVAKYKQFAYAEANFGAGYKDPMFVTYWKDMNKVIHRGAYDFAQPGETSLTDLFHDAQTECAVFLSQVNSGGGIQSYDLPVMLDVEQNPHGLTPNQYVSWMVDWVGCFLGAVPHPWRPPIIYTNDNFGTWLAKATNLSEIAGWGIWIASYNPSSSPSNIGPWTRWTCWQYADNGTVPGITTAVDLDEWYQGASSFPSWVDPMPTPAPAPTITLADLAAELTTVKDAVNTIGATVKGLEVAVNNQKVAIVGTGDELTALKTALADVGKVLGGL